MIFPTVYDMNPFREKNIFSCVTSWWRHIGRKKNFFHQRGSYHIPLESPHYADSESSKNHGLKNKSWRDILIWIWVWWRHVTNLKSKYLSRTSFSDHGSYVILNQHNTSFLTVYNMTTIGEKSFFVHYDMTSHDHVTSQENWPWEDFKKYQYRNFRPNTDEI